RQWHHRATDFAFRRHASARLCRAPLRRCADERTTDSRKQCTRGGCNFRWFSVHLLEHLCPLTRAQCENSVLPRVLYWAHHSWDVARLGLGSIFHAVKTSNFGLDRGTKLSDA